MDWTKVTVYTSKDGIEPVLGILLNFGIDSAQVTDESEFNAFLEENRSFWDYVDENLEKSMQGETHIDFYIKSSELEIVQDIEAELKKLKSSDKNGDFGKLSLECEKLSGEDWENSWKKHFHTFSIGEKLIIKPYWEEAEPCGKKVFEINPGLSFGTGTHHTTKMCLEDIVNIIKGGESVLDLGSGSGILAIVSLLFGAENAVAVDIDENSKKTISENLKRNNIDGDRCSVYIGNLLEDEHLRAKIAEKRYDVVYANIVADVVIALLPINKSVLKKDGIFIASGIIEDRITEVKDKILSAGFSIISEKRSADWAEFKCSL
ncbi:MAG: 50S ribosomal protein L11 methyltransferase [Clostridia bacterium]|nr:50S ribosomal protein L11 methyltransferase [Clostridia bacterium]